MSELVVDHGTEEPNIGARAMLGAVIGFVVVTAFVTIAGTLGADLELGAAFGLGAFIGIWGGAGFGFMMGATIPLARHLDGRAAHNRRGETR